MSKTIPINDIVAIAYNKWSHQGRTDEQKWAVENFLSGSFTMAEMEIAEQHQRQVEKAFNQGVFGMMIVAIISLILVRILL